MYLTQGIHRALQQDPDAPMTFFGDRVRTVRQSADRIAGLAGALRRLGVAEGDRIAMLSFNSDRFHEYLMATWWIGAVVVPLNIRWAVPENLYALRQSGARVLLVDEAFAPLVPDLSEDLDIVVHCADGPAPPGMLAYEDLAGDDPVPDGRYGGDRLAGIFYTGGTTGFPKGVMLSHANLLVSAMGSQAAVDFVVPGGRLLHASPMFHLADLAAWVAQCLVGGAHVIIPAFEPAAALAAVAARRATSALLAPIMIRALVEHPGLAASDLSSLRTIVYGASPIPEETLERAMAALPGTAFVQAYGMTELAPVATLLPAADHAARRRLRSCGRAAPHTEVRIVDRDGAEVPRGQVGEVAVRGANVMLGYWREPEQTARAVRDGWMHTGDGAYMDDDGYVHIVDRLKDMIVTGGENVYSVEVENVIARHPAVAACAVIGVPDETWGERVHAVIVRRPGHTLGHEEIRDYCKYTIAGYKAPRSTEFIEELPSLPTGKILKRELRERYWNDQPRSVR
ncbi:acyl-CoA synthetase [Actinomadura macrotermitis]|uniref:Long-chain-fatty-acid--CoA ligase n=1 Tax=Actinomadura macrotermitis TaxID=2585200 RepID=A0A7K0C2I0_9ACTN|nr:long-chain fatty acid--CoA ligase [Actinomadura macrotermitis]MQY07649.1 Long-chain-fatty-acid--CoA ligase [Actinomadura macrotermitis]